MPGVSVASVSLPFRIELPNGKPNPAARIVEFVQMASDACRRAQRPDMAPWLIEVLQAAFQHGAPMDELKRDIDWHLHWYQAHWLDGASANAIGLRAASFLAEA